MCDPYLAGIYGRKLQLAGIKVKISENPEEGLRSAIQNHAKVIVLDIECLADIDSFLKEIKSQVLLQQTKVILFATMGERNILFDYSKKVDGILIYGHFVPREAVKKILSLLN